MATNALAWKRKHGGIEKKPPKSSVSEKSISLDNVRKYAHAFYEGGSGAHHGITSCTLRTAATENKRLMGKIAQHMLQECDKRQVAHAYLELVTSNIDSLALNDFHKQLLLEIQTGSYDKRCAYK